MRRPSPLPATPPERRQPAAAREHRAVAAPSQGARDEAEAVGSDATETTPLEDLGPAASGRLAPVIRFAQPADPTAASGAASVGSSSDAPAGPGVDTSDRPVGVRDVWAAARARRRALRREVRRFTVRQRRRRYAWIAAAGAVLLVGVGAVGAAYSPLFAVEEITVVGTDRLDADAVEASLAAQRGTPLALVDSSAVKAALVGFPLVETYTIEARPPHELVVRIVERMPVGVVSTRAGFALVDAAGVVLATAAEAPEGYPVIDAAGGPGSRTFRAVGSVYRSLPADLRPQVTKITATTPEDVTLTIDGAKIVWGNADDAVEKARNLTAAMVERPPADVDEYDVSSPGAVVVR